MGDLSANLDKPAVLVPGTHHDADGRKHTIGSDQFTSEALAKLPPGTLYRKGEIVGQIVGEPGKRTFRQLTAEAMRLLVDGHLHLVRIEQESGRGESAKRTLFDLIFVGGQLHSGQFLTSEDAANNLLGEFGLARALDGSRD